MFFTCLSRNVVLAAEPSVVLVTVVARRHVRNVLLSTQHASASI
jgi:hypothetical protein